MNTALLSLLIATGITLAGMLVNYLYYLENRWMLLCVTMHGGEITVQFGFGLRLVRIFAMMEGERDSIKFGFDIISFILTLALIFIIVFIIIWFIRKGGRTSV